MFGGRRRHTALIDEALRVIRDQQALIETQRRTIDAYELMHVRSVRDLVEHFLIAHESGIDVRDELLDGLRDLSDHVARLEEHA